MSNDLFEKVVTTSNIGTGGPGNGYLSREQADKFIEYTWDATTLWQEARKIVMNSPEKDVQAIAVGARIVRGAKEAVDTGENAGATWSKVTLRTSKLRLDWEVSRESLEDNIEGNDLDAHLARLFAEQLGNDLEELSIHGDTDSSDPLLKVMDGWHKQAVEGGRVVQHSGGLGSQITRAHFNAALKKLPRKYRKRKQDLRFYGSTNLVQDFLYNDTQNGIVTPDMQTAALGNMPIVTGAAGAVARVYGVDLKEVPLFDTEFNEVNSMTGTDADDDTAFLELTDPSNRILGIQRQIETFREFKPKKDAIEYTTFIRFALAWGNLDAVVTVNNIPVVE